MINNITKKTLGFITALSLILGQNIFAFNTSAIPTNQSVSWLNYNLSSVSYMCNDIHVNQSFDTLTSDVTCKVGKNVSSVKIDCGNWDTKVFNTSWDNVTHTCVYSDWDIEYKAQCLTSTRATLEASEIKHANYKCNQRYTFDEEVERKRKIAEINSRKAFENYVIVNNDYYTTQWSVSSEYWKKITVANSIQNDYMNNILDNNRFEYLKNLQYKTWTQFVSQYPQVLPKTWAPKAISFNKNVTPTYVQKLLPENIGYYAEEYNDDIDFWKQGVIKEDRNRDIYIVVPTKGMVIPVNKQSEDTDYYKSMKSWEEVDINEHLKDWAAIYAWTETKTFWSVWNPLIYGHSSYFTSKEWNYKTHFQSIIDLPKWEEIWVFEKNTHKNTYKRYRYTINESYETEKNDFSILEEKEWRNMTLITCTPIWGTTKRWVIKTTYIDEEYEELQRKIHGSNFSLEYWNSANTIIWELTKLPTNVKREKIITLYWLIEQAENNEAYWETTDFLKYFKRKLVSEYYNDYR